MGSSTRPRKYDGHRLPREGKQVGSPSPTCTPRYETYRDDVTNAAFYEGNTPTRDRHHSRDDGGRAHLIAGILLRRTDIETKVAVRREVHRRHRRTAQQDCRRVEGLIPAATHACAQMD